MKALANPSAVAHPAGLSLVHGPISMVASAIAWTVAFNAAWRGRRQLADLPEERLQDVGLTVARREELLSITLTQDPVFRATRAQVFAQLQRGTRR